MKKARPPFHSLMEGNDLVDVYILTKVLKSCIKDNEVHAGIKTITCKSFPTARVFKFSNGTYYTHRGFRPSRNLDHSIEFFKTIMQPKYDAVHGTGVRQRGDRFVLDSLGYRCCKKEKDGMHGQWRCTLVDAKDGTLCIAHATADTPAMAVCKAVIQAVRWLKRGGSKS